MVLNVLIKGLFKDVGYIILRGLHGSGELRPGSDLDIWVETHDKGRFLQNLKYSKDILQFDIITGFDQITFLKLGLYSETLSVQLDLFFGDLKCGSMIYATSSWLRKNSYKNGQGISLLADNEGHLNKVKEAVWNGGINDWRNKDVQFSFQITSGSPKFWTKYPHVFVRTWYSKLTIKRIVSLFRKFSQKPGLSISLTGLDGSGKSSLIKLLRDELDGAYHGKVKIYHLRPGILPSPSSFKRKGNNDGSDVSNVPYGTPPKGRLASLLLFLYYLLDYQIGYFCIAIRTRLNAELFIFDMCSLDLIADPARFGLNIPMWLRKLSSKVLRDLDLQFFIECSVETLLSRKDDLTAITANQNIIKYGLFSDGYTIIPNEGEIADAFKLIADEIFSKKKLDWIE